MRRSSRKDLSCSGEHCFTIESWKNWAHSRARAAIEKALEVDEHDPDAQTMLGVLRTVYELDWEGAARAFRNALRTHPNSADISIWYAWHSWVRGRFDDALARVETALELDPLSPLPQQLRALVLYCKREYREAIERFQQVLDLHPDWILAEMHLADAYCEVGDFERAESRFLRARELDPDHSHYAHARLCCVRAALGKRDEASKALDELLAIRKKRYIPPGYLAIGFLGIGDLDEVFRLLEEESTVQLAVWAVMPWSDPVRSDPRFQRVLERLGDR